MKLIRRTVVLLCVIGLSGCAGSQTKSYTGPTGELTSTIRCTIDPSGCFEKASNVCSSKPYKVVSSYRNSGGLIVDFFPGPVTWYTMSIICGSSNGHMPRFPLRGSEPAMPEFNIPQNPTEINIYN
tara:strand:+ start:157 stop:534 length:378 start_codon:yes stop_codon:yes gene_type:complete